MAKELKRDQPLELIIQRKGKTIYARLREDREFTVAEVNGAAAFTAQFPSLDKVKKELKDLLMAGGFKIVVPVNSALAPEQAQVVVFGDMTSAVAAPVAAVRPAPAPHPVKPRPEPPQPAAAPQAPPPAAVQPQPAPRRTATAKPARKKLVFMPKSASTPPPAAPPAPVAPPAAPQPHPARGGNEEEKAFKAFYDQWRARNKISRLPKEELEELRRGEWQEVKERFMAEWRKGK